MVFHDYNFLQDQLEDELDFDFKEKSFITFHPVILKIIQVRGKLMSCWQFCLVKKHWLIFTMPNSDTDGRLIFEKIDSFT